jgi:TrmH family RNA methyltransferase
LDAVDVASFLREVGEDQALVELAEQLLAGGARVVESGWRGPEGVLVLGAAAGPRPVVVAATSERALRDLLLRGLPRGEPLRVRVAHAWHLEAVAELVDGRPAADAEGGFLGVKRGAAQPQPPAGALLRKGDAVVELLRDLAQPAGRERHGRFVVEGPVLVGRAIAGGLPVETVVHRADLLRDPAGAALLDGARDAGIACWRASDGLLGSLTASRPLPDVLAAVHLRLRDASDLSAAQARVLLIAENLQNPDNLGMVLRTADAAGVDAVVAAGAPTDPLHRNCVRAARGAVGRLPIFRCADLPAWIGALRARGFQVLGATAHGDLGLFEANLEPPVALVVGNEETGIAPETLAACTARLVIPMAPGQDSLNVGVAAGVALFELARQRTDCSRTARKPA